MTDAGFTWRTIAGTPPVDATPFHALDRVAIVLGSTMLGAVAGVIITIALGPQPPLLVAQYAAPALLIGLYLAYAECRETNARRTWIGMPCAWLLLLALPAWPALILIAPEFSETLIRPIAFTMLSACVLLAAGESHEVYRSSVIALLTAALASNQELLVIMGR